MRTTKHCTCRFLGHQPTDCPYENGCTDCCCQLQAHNVEHFCAECDHYTTHPDRHDHAATATS